MTKQDQSVGDNAEGYQAARDLIVHKGMDAGQMAEIMVALAGQLQGYFADAESKAKARMTEFKEEILNEFARPDSVGNRQAFSDPDFQFVLRDAHQSFARSGDTVLRDELVRLVAQRSSAAGGTRTALILNRAIGIAGTLTEQEYAVLCISFAFKNVKLSANSPSQLAGMLNLILGSFSKLIPDSEHSIEYLESIGCLSVSQFSSIDLWKHLTSTYGHIYSKGFTLKELEEAATGSIYTSKLQPYLVPILNDFSGKVCFADLAEPELRAALIATGAPTNVIDNLMALRQGSLASPTDVQNHLLNAVPAMAAVEASWTKTSLQKTNLTALGKALGHSTLVSRAAFQAPLDIWVR